MPLQGALLTATIPRAMPWLGASALSGRAASDLLGLQPVLEPHAKVQLLIFKAKIIKKKETSKNLMIFYSFPFNFIWKSLMTLMTMNLMTGFLSFLYPMQLVTPSVVAIAVSMLMAICRIVFQVFAFIFFEC